MEKKDQTGYLSCKGLGAADKLPPVYVLIAAAGTGSRMGTSVNKQFLSIRQMPVIVRTVMIFDKMPEIQGIRLICSDSDLGSMQQLFDKYRCDKLLGFSRGGETRQYSVLNGLTDLSADIEPGTSPIVLIHDGARCLCSQDLVRRCIATITSKKAACAAAVPVKDTIKSAKTDNEAQTTRQEEAQVDMTLDRDRLWAIQTPQGAFFSEIYKAYQDVTDNCIQVTDDLAVMEAAGFQTWLSLGDYRNIKITTPEDLLIAEALAAEIPEA